MANAILSFGNYLDLSTTLMSAQSQVSSLPVTNLQSYSPQVPWRATGPSAWSQADFGTVKPIGVFVAVIPRVGPRLAATDTVRIQYDNDTPGSGVVWDSGTVVCGIDPRVGYLVITPPAGISARYRRTTYNSSGTYLQVGREWDGASLQPGSNFEYRAGRQWSDESVVTYGPRSGVRFTDAGPRRRVMTFTFPSLSAADALLFEDGDVDNGSSRQFLLIGDPDSPARTSIIGVAQQMTPISRDNFVLSSKAYSIMEDL